jgi:hypothetical protein
MHPDLQRIADEFTEAQRRLHRLADTCADQLWARRPAPERWSAAECVAHLQLTAEAFLPSIRRALDEGCSAGRRAPRRYRRDPLGWLLWRLIGPPARVRVPTPARFAPQAAEPGPQLLAGFDRLQAEQLRCVQEADGLPLGRLRIVSPFDPRVRYNIYSALSILARHQHRHLWQAERALETAAGAR